MSKDFEIHPGFVVHWVGKEFDKRFKLHKDGSVHEENIDEQLDGESRTKYLNVLKSILKDGLKMGVEHNNKIIIDNEVHAIPSIPRVCFTELKLSQCIIHARKYGCLGVAVKRPFCFHRGGRPVIYYRQHENLIRKDIFLKQLLRLKGKNYDSEYEDILQFFKPMGPDEDHRFEFFDESEWRIILDKKLKANEDFTRQVNSQYYLRLDGWLSGIIYPDSETKNAAIKDKCIRDYINNSTFGALDYNLTL